MSHKCGVNSLVVTVLFALFLLGIPMGCAGTPGSDSRDGMDLSESGAEPDLENAHPPEMTLEYLREFLQPGSEQWDRLYRLMSTRTRSCYSEGELRQFFSRTIPGNLERARFLYWHIEEIRETEEPYRREVILQHYRDTSYTQTYPMVLEGNIWRLDWSLADLFQVPRDIEDCDS